MKLFIDECLSSELVHRAVARGHAETTSVVFRGTATAPGEKGLYRDVELHPGFICLNGPRSMDLDTQLELFDIAFNEIERLQDDLVNKYLEIMLDSKGGEVEITLYDLPTP